MRNLCIVFDLDDTLFLERDFVRSGFRAAGAWAQAKLGLNSLDLRAWELFEDGHRGDIFDRLLEECGTHRADLVQTMVRIYQNHVPTLILPTDSRTCLNHFRGRAKLAIITDGARTTQMQKCRSLELHSYCRPILINSLLREYKPNPVSFERLISRLGGSDFAYVYVGDNPAKDFQAPRALGWMTVRVRRPGGLHHAKECLPDYRPDFEIADLDRLHLLL